MTLTLEVAPPQAATLGDARRRVFSSQGGTIGRATSCDWVLSHRKVSGRHATITYQDSVFYIVDHQSANGVFLNTTKNRLVPGRRYALKTGDHIIIDPYDIEVSITGERTLNPFQDMTDGRERGGKDSPFSADPFAEQTARPPQSPTPPSSSLIRSGEVVPSEEVDPLKFWKATDEERPVRPAASVKHLEDASLLNEHYEPPPVPVAPPVRSSGTRVSIPPHYDALRDVFG